MDTTIRDKILLLVEELINSRLDESKEAFSPNKGWTDAVKQYLAAMNESDEAYYTSPNKISLEDHVHRRLGHIVVMPRDRFNSKALRECYVYSKDDNILDSKHVNRNADSAKKFVDTLTKSAITLGNDSSGRLDTKIDAGGISAASKGDTLYLLHGRRGTGKTFYLNHLISRFSDDFDKNNVLWIRINLLNDFGNNTNITHWMYAQLTKVISRFYDGRSPFFRKKDFPKLMVNVRELLMTWAEQQDDDMRIYYKGKISGMEQVFHSKHRIEPISPTLIDEQLARQLYIELVERGFKFIFVLDGFDRVEALKHASMKFKSLRDSIANLVGNSDSPGYTILLVTRSCNLNLFVKDGNGRIRVPIENIKCLDEVSLERIIDKRLEYIDDEVTDILTSTNQPGWSMDDWPSDFKEFKAFVWEKSKDYTNRLELIYGPNRRAQMQSLQLSYFEFLDKVTRKRYKLVESLTRAGRRFPPRSYEYYLRDNRLRRSLGNNIFDNHLLPNVFCFPYYSGSEREAYVTFPSNHSLLMGVRLIQLLQAHTKLREEIKLDGSYLDAIKAHELASICSVLFGYSDESFIKLVEEFGEYDILLVGGIDILSAPDAKEYTPIAMPKMEYIISNLIYDAAYLNLCSMRVPLNPCVISYTENPLVRAAKYPSDELKMWIASLVINSISMIRMISYCNIIEQDMFNENITKIDEYRLKRTANRALVDGMFTIGERARESVVKQLKNIIYTSSNDIAEYLVPKLEKYSSKWATQSDTSLK
jgi:Cdc6-like AAA superfamily ATPase